MRPSRGNAPLASIIARTADEHHSLLLKRKRLILPSVAMNAMRNKIVYNCFGIEPGIVRQTVRNDLPELRRKLQALLDARAGA